jgi:hypothetical protein
MITSDYYSEYELYKTEDLNDIENSLKTYFDTGVYEMDPSKHELIGSQDTVDADDAIETADKILYIDDYDPAWA